MTRDAEILAARAEGQTYAEIARAVGLSRQRVCQICHRPPDVRTRHNWTAQDDATLRALWVAGTPVQSIALQFGVSCGSIRQRVGILDLPLRRPPITTHEVARVLSLPGPAHVVAAQVGRCAVTIRKLRRPHAQRSPAPASAASAAPRPPRPESQRQTPGTPTPRIPT